MKIIIIILVYIYKINFDFMKKIKLNFLFDFIDKFLNKINIKSINNYQVLSTFLLSNLLIILANFLFFKINFLLFFLFNLIILFLLINFEILDDFVNFDEKVESKDIDDLIINWQIFVLGPIIWYLIIPGVIGAFFYFSSYYLSYKTENNSSLIKKTFYVLNWPCSKCAIFLFALFGSYPKVMAVTKSKMFNKNVEDQTELVIDACRTSFVDNSDNPGLMKDNVNDLLASSTTGFIVIILISYLVFKFLI